MNPVFLVLLIVLFLYFVSILNNNSIEKFDITEPGIDNTQTCSSSGDVFQGPNYSGCDSRMCSTELKNPSSSIRKCYMKGNAGQRCNVSSCNSGLTCGRLNRDVSSNSNHENYCLTKPYSCKGPGTPSCLEGETCRKRDNNGYKCS